MPCISRSCVTYKNASKTGDTLPLSVGDSETFFAFSTVTPFLPVFQFQNVCRDIPVSLYRFAFSVVVSFSQASLNVISFFIC